LQEILALLVVAAVVVAAVLRYLRRRRAPAPGCGTCGDKPATRRESPVRFYRRRP
jgi:hypothetical protein